MFVCVCASSKGFGGKQRNCQPRNEPMEGSLKPQPIMHHKSSQGGELEANQVQNIIGLLTALPQLYPHSSKS